MTGCVTLCREQFTQTDPMPYGAGSSFEGAYVYGHNNPEVYIDSSGLRSARVAANPIVECANPMGDVPKELAFVVANMKKVALPRCPRRAVAASATMSIVFSGKSPQQYEIQVTSLVDVQNTEVEWNGVPSEKGGQPRDKASSAAKNKARKGGYNLKFGHISTGKLLSGSVLNVRTVNFWNREHWIDTPAGTITGEEWPGGRAFFSCVVE